MDHGCCPRCDREVELEWSSPWVRKHAWIYFALGTPYVPLTPIIGSDGFVMIPSFALYMLGVVHVIATLREAPTCRACGCEITLPRESSRWRRRLDARRWRRAWRLGGA